MSNRWVILLAVLLLCTGATAQQADYSKMSALVRRAAIDGQPARRVAIAGQSSRRAADNEGRTRLLTAFVRLSDAADAETLLSGMDCRLLAQQGDIAIASIPISQIGRLSALPQVMRIEAGRRATTLMDTTRAVVNALPAYQPTPRHNAFTGRGVVMGLMDVGFDLSHPNFYNNADAADYRIRAFWDQLSSDTVGSRLPVGRDYHGRQEILPLGCATDGRTEDHGTHTLGIAAGCGFGSPYCGMAPESDICLVANAVTSDTIYISPDDYYKYTTATDALGFQYLFDYADSQGQPCVASFSEGYNAMNDADDRLFAEYLDRLNSPGHIIVVSAGNQGHLTTYASKSAAQTEAGAFINAGNKTVNYCLQIHGETRLHIYYYNDGKTTPTDTLTIHSSDGRLDSLVSDTIRTTADTLAITASRHPAAFGTATILQITITASRHTSTLNRIALVVGGGNGEAEIFGSSSCQLVSRTNIDPRWTAAQPGHNILAPGWFPAAICVGMTAHRQQFTNIRGEQQAIIPNKTAGILSDYSSRGPTMEGLTKPDVVAPGINTVSSISGYYREANPTAGDASFDIASFDFGNRTYYWGAKSGTSMSCPVVAGAIALWLQAKPTLTREEIIGIFARTCRRPDASLTYPNNDYGWGEIDVYRGLLDILGLTAVETISQHRQQAATMRIADGRLTMQFSSAPSHPVSVSVYSVAGCRLQQWHFPAGSREASVELPRLPGGIYAIQLTSRDSRITGSQLVRIE